MSQFNNSSLNNFLTTLFYIDIIVAFVAFGLFAFAIWLLYTWVISYRDWSRNEINVRKNIARESIARARKLRAEAQVIEHDIDSKGLKLSQNDENDLSVTSRSRL